eukprot:CFRG5008T1
MRIRINSGVLPWLMAVSGAVCHSIHFASIFIGPSVLISPIRKDLGLTIDEATLPLSLVRLIQCVGLIPVVLFGGLPTLLKVAGTWFDSDSFSVASSIIISGFSLAGFLAPVLLGTLSEEYGWRIALLVIDLCLLLVALPLCLLFVKENHNSALVHSFADAKQKDSIYHLLEDEEHTDVDDSVLGGATTSVNGRMSKSEDVSRHAILSVVPVIHTSRNRNLLPSCETRPPARVHEKHDKVDANYPSIHRSSSICGSEGFLRKELDNQLKRKLSSSTTSASADMVGYSCNNGTSSLKYVPSMDCSVHSLLSRKDNLAGEGTRRLCQDQLRVIDESMDDRVDGSEDSGLDIKDGLFCASYSRNRYAHTRGYSSTLYRIKGLMSLQFILLVCNIAFMSVCAHVVFDHLTVYIHEDLEQSLAISARYIAIVNLFALFTKLSSGFLVRFVEHHSLLMIFSFLLMLGFITILDFHPHDEQNLVVLTAQTAKLYVSSVFFGMGYAGIIAVSTALLPSMGKDTIALRSSIQIASLFFFGAIGSYVAGKLRESSESYLRSFMFGLATSVLCLCMSISNVIRQRRQSIEVKKYVSVEYADDASM